MKIEKTIEEHYYFESENSIFPYNVVNYIYNIAKFDAPSFCVDIGLTHKESYNFNEPLPYIRFGDLEEMENKIKHFTTWKNEQLKSKELL